jgi:hypothetical protein
MGGVRVDSPNNARHKGGDAYAIDHLVFVVTPEQKLLS